MSEKGGHAGTKTWRLDYECLVNGSAGRLIELHKAKLFARYDAKTASPAWISWGLGKPYSFAEGFPRA
jgi:hypothetical protein